MSFEPQTWQNPSDSLTDLEIRIKAAFDEAANEAQVVGPWQPLPYAAPWTDYGSGHRKGQYRTEPGNVIRLRGLIKGGAVGSVIGTLPVHPTETEIFNQQANQAAARVDINIDGTIKFVAGTVGWVSLAGITFVAD